MHTKSLTGVLLALAATPLAAQQRTVTLSDAIQLALRAQPTYIQAVGDASVAHTRQREYLGSWLPTISLPTSMSKSSSTRIDATTQQRVSAPASTSYSAGLNLSMNIFDGFRREAQGHANGANAESADANVVVQQFGVILQTKQTFFNAVAAEELVQVADARVKRAEEQLKVAKEKLAAGSAIRSDTLQAFVELGNSKLQLLTAQSQQATAEAQLARLIGVDGAVRPETDSMPAPATLDTVGLRAEVLQHAPSINQALAQASAADAQVGVSRAQYFPSLTASYSNSYGGTALSALANTWSARIGLSWTLFNGFTRETNMAQAEASRDAATARADDARRQVNAQLTQYLAAVQTASASAAIAQASRAAAEEGLRVQQERYRLGAATIVDVLNSQLALGQAESDLVQAHLNYQVAKAQIEALVGRTLQ